MLYSLAKLVPYVGLFLGVSHTMIYKLMKEGLPSHKIGKKRVFLKEDLIKWIRDH